ncbi:MAG: DUF4209 domain-containing protein [Nitrospirae bacterium]|nr:DUF4209 domain-containing protein [Nitrospirota bacterium]
MALKNIQLTKSDFDSLPWPDVINDCAEKECEVYSSKFFAKAREFEEAKNEKAQEVFSLLGAICSFHFKPDDKNEPFGPMVVLHTGRSAIIDDIRDDHIKVLQDLLLHVEDADLRARIADIIWIRKRDYKAAEVAIDSYLESAILLENPDSWVAGFERINRAFRLSVQLGRNTNHWKKVVSHIETTLDKYDGGDPLYLSARLMELLLEISQGDPSKYSSLSEKIAKQAENKGDFHRARTYWEIKAHWEALAGNNEAEKKAKIITAETYVKEAETANSSLVASTWLEKAIESYRRIGGQKDRIDELHSKLIDVQKNIAAEMKQVSHEMDISELIEKHRNHISGRNFHDALFEFCLMGAPPNIANLRNRVEELIKKHPLQFLVSGSLVNEKGKVIGRKPYMMSNDPEEVERAKKAEMYSQAKFDHNIKTHGLIEPVRMLINLEHNVQIRDFYPIVQNSPFVPEGREQIFAQGLHTGLKGDYMTAAHLLIPQVENSIRYILEKKGVTVSRLDEQGIQDERPLNDILYCSEIEEIFGEDLAFDLRGLLVERFGSNLRNMVAHGLMSYSSFYSIEVPYFWWTTLRLCCLPIVAHLKSQTVEAPEDAKKSEGD